MHVGHDAILITNTWICAHSTLYIHTDVWHNVYTYMSIMYSYIRSLYKSQAFNYLYVWCFSHITVISRVVDPAATVSVMKLVYSVDVWFSTSLTLGILTDTTGSEL